MGEPTGQKQGERESKEVATPPQARLAVASLGKMRRG